MNVLPATCPKCGWTQTPAGVGDDELARVAQLLEAHLGLEHDVTWARAWEEASTWVHRARAQATPGELPQSPGEVPALARARPDEP